MKPGEIEALSFKIIEDEAGDHGFSSDKWQIVRRMIHTSADFEYIKTVRFHPNAISAGISAIKKGCRIITDTNMAKTGIRKGELSFFNGTVHCFICDNDVAKRSKEEEITRAEVSVDKAFDTNKNGIFVIGNAPTALFRLI